MEGKDTNSSRIYYFNLVMVIIYDFNYYSKNIKAYIFFQVKKS